MECCSARCGLIAGAVLGALIAVLGGILIPVGNSIIRDTIIKEAIIENGTTAYENWVTAGAPVYRQFWLFDVQNPSAVVELGAKPVVVQRGPYTYRTRYLPKENITAFDNATISFILPAGAIFQPIRSIGVEEDTITALNLAVAGAYSLVPKFLHPALNLAIKRNNASLFQRKTVKELLWGYFDPIRNGMVGVFHPYNGTYDGPYAVFTGKDNIGNVALIDKWNGERQLKFWDDPFCNMINGTDATSFPPFLDKKPLFFFSSDICRSVAADFERSVVLKGIKLNRHTLNPLALASPAVNPDNHCYCRDRLVTRNCTMAGVLDVSACRGGMPIYISLAHFLHGSPQLTQDVLGLKPVEEEHFTYLDVEPITGTTMRFAKRLQVNMMYGTSDTIDVLKQVKDYTIFPLLWLNETAVLDDETADMFKAKLTSRMEMLEMVQVALLSVGSAVFILCSVAACVVHRISRSKLV